MSDLDFKLEYFKGDTASDEGVYIQLRSNPSGFIKLVSREEYNLLAEEDLVTIVTALFACPGVVRVAVQAYRVWIEKSPVFGWSEVLGPVIEQLRIDTGQLGVNELPGSPTYLKSNTERRSTN